MIRFTLVCKAFTWTVEEADGEGFPWKEAVDSFGLTDDETDLLNALIQKINEPCWQ